MRDHRVPLLGDSWRRTPDPERSADPRVQLVLAGLRELSAGPAPEPVFRSELRAQLVAIAPRIVAEGDVDTVPALPSRPVVRSVSAGAPVAVGAGGSGRFHVGGSHVSGASVRRVSVATACTVVVMGMLLGLGLLMSRNAVPGDALYGLKRAGENFQLATDSDSQKSTDLLRFAGRRVEEAQTLASRGQASASGGGLQAAGALNSTTGRQIQDALASADSDVRQAARLLGGQAVDSESAAPLTKITQWAPGQLERLRQLWDTLGSASPVSPQVTRSVALVTSAQDRAEALGTKVDCGCLVSAPSDSLGPKPCQKCSSRSATTSAPRRTAVPQVPVPSGAAVDPGTSNPAHATTGPLAPAATPTQGGSKPTSVLPLPTRLPITVPTKKLTPPVRVDTCGVHVTLGGLKVNVGSCKTS